MAYWNEIALAAEPAGTTVSERRRSMARSAFSATLAAALLLALAAGGVLAAKATSAVWVNELSASALASTSALQLGDRFSVGYQSREREPFALARCYPNETTEYTAFYADGSIWGQVFSVYEGGPTPQAFQLGASVHPLWTGGGADCTVELVKYSRDLTRMTVLATASFTSAP